MSLSTSATGRLGHLVVLLAVVLLGLERSARAEEFVAPPPAWVVPAELPAFTPEREAAASGGLYDLLLDRQVKWRPGRSEFHRRHAYRVLTREGLEKAATLSVDYDPSHETIAFDSVLVRRGAERIDLTAGTRFESFRQERSLDDGILDGRVTVHANLPDIRVGDVVDYAYTLVETPKILPNGFSARFGIEWSVPIARQRLRLTMPQGTKLAQRSRADARLSPVASEEGAESYEWTATDPDVVLGEPAVPDGYEKWAFLEVTTLGGWGEIVDDLLPYYAVDPAALPAAFAAEVDRIAAAYPEPEARLARTLRLVQDTIRYVGLEIGKGSYHPRSPAEVIATGYGDCKDKALLLVTALGRLGIEASVALADLDEGKALGSRLPSPYAFDHAIVLATIKGRDYWVDATRTHQGGTGADVVTADYGWGLPLRPGSTVLLPMPRAEPEEPTAETVETFDVPARRKRPIRLAVVTTYRGAEAEAARARVAGKSLAEIGRDYAEYYGRNYPGTTPSAPLRVEDDRDANVLVIHESYRIDRAELAEGLVDDRFEVNGSFLDDFLERPDGGRRRDPVRIPHPVHRRHTVVIQGEPVDMNALAAKTVDTEFFRLSLASESSPGRFRVEWILRTKADAVPAADVRRYLRSAEEAVDLLFWEYGLVAVVGEDKEKNFGEAAPMSFLGGFAPAALAAMVVNHVKELAEEAE